MDSLNSLTINKQMLFVFSLIAFARNIPKQVKHECNYDTETNVEHQTYSCLYILLEN